MFCGKTKDLFPCVICVLWILNLKKNKKQKRKLSLGLWALLNVIKHVSAEISFETWKLRYALVTAVPRSVKDTGVRLETQVGKLPFQQWPLRSKRIPACAEPSRNALDFWRWNTWALAASEGAQQGGTFTESLLSYPIRPICLARHVTSRHGGPIIVDVPYTVAS